MKRVQAELSPDILRNYWHSNIQSIVNIHTHLWGAVLFSYLLATFYPTYLQLHGITTWRDSAVIDIFLLSAIFCLAASAFYHTSGCHSEKVRHQHGHMYSKPTITLGCFSMSCIWLFRHYYPHRWVVLSFDILWILLWFSYTSILPCLHNHYGFR